MAVCAAILCLAVCVFDVMSKAGTCGTSVRNVMTELSLLFIGKEFTKMASPWGCTIWSKKVSLLYRYSQNHYIKPEDVQFEANKYFCCTDVHRTITSSLPMHNLNIFCFFFFFKLYCPIQISPMGNLGCLPWEKLAATELRYPTYSAYWVF